MSDRLFEVLNVTPEGTVFLRAFDNREVLQRKRDDIALDIGAGVARLRLPPPRVALKTVSMPSIEEKLRTDIALLSPAERKVFERRWAYIKAITSAQLVELERERTLAVVKSVATDNADKRPPSYATVSRWHRTYVAGGRDMRALFPNTRRRGRRTRRLPPEVLKIARDVIYENYLTREQLTGRRTYDALISAIDEQNNRPGRTSQLPFPSLRWVFDEIRRVADPYEIKARREGKAAADQHFRAVYQGPRPYRPLERVEIDHTVLDLMVVDDEYGTVIGRPTLTLAIDVATRMIVGLHLGFAAPSALVILRCLRNIIFPKHEIVSRYPSIKNTWDAYGVPETIVVDNGGELHAATVEEACRRLNIRMQHAPRKTPRYKGTVERLFGIINTEVLTGVP
ncbi:MAG: DDE-type integrase/transposase/recombinase, partial [Ferrovibrio sp.]|uniref:DDE-type integrase/transposase/recombinase n=1 Tax=Ferrovibrio sp. TaxID=1917215 RepID=UPI002605772D